MVSIISPCRLQLDKGMQRILSIQLHTRLFSLEISFRQPIKLMLSFSFIIP